MTGATSGIGRAFAQRLADEGHDLILVARTHADLENLAGSLHRESGPRVETLAADLSTPEGCRTVTDRLASKGAVDLLVNNEGIMLSKPFPRTSIAAEELMLDINVRAVLRLTHAVLPAMIERGSGRVVNVASFSAFGPRGLATTYPASKSWVLAFTDAVGRSAYVRRSGVRMMTLLPGFTRTEIFERSGIEPARVPNRVWLRPQRVVATALRDLGRGRPGSVPSLRYKVAAWRLRHLPRPLLLPLSWDFSAPSGFWKQRARR
ncbi:SDR family NAD(P)-dependent oxidoreductase [Streptomyces sp. NBC_01450]|uniref:SDR family NAD(P)-dependent oxidoreductase n=1 Tax=Streptomyces sp. NBC_01450 TaxID=2903871 RepID=UPI002E34996A|nr:SDR family NAD(P)-dependent oxidoreductase [Streptomyces sp. NBC_01450]